MDPHAQHDAAQPDPHDDGMPAGGESSGGESSRWEDVIDIFLTPADVFRRRAHDRVGPPLATLLGASVALYLLLLPANRLIFEANIPDDPQARAFMDQYGTLLQLLGAVAVPITYLVMISFAALLLWAGAALFDVRLPAGRALLVATYAGFVLLVGQIAAAVLVLLHGAGPIDVHRDTSIGALRFVSEPGPVLAAALRRFEVFALWQAALWGVGVRHVARTAPGKAALLAAIAWLLHAVPPVVAALIRPTPAG